MKRLEVEKLYMPYGPKAEKHINITGAYLEEIPNINEILSNNIKEREKCLTMEEMVENAMRRNRMGFEKDG